MNVATYVRVRADNKRTEAEKRRDQQDCLDRWALKQGLEVAAAFQDCGFSALDLSRPGLRGLLEAANGTPRPFDAVLVVSLDRLARNFVDFARLERRLRGFGVDIQIPDPPERNDIDRDEIQRFLRLIDDNHVVNDRCDLLLSERSKSRLEESVSEEETAMRKNRFMDKQIIGFLRQADTAVAVRKSRRQHGSGDAEFYKWRALLGGIQAGDATRLREIEVENAKLKKLLAETHLHIEALRVGFGMRR